LTSGLEILTEGGETMEKIIGQFQLFIYDDDLADGLKRLLNVEVKCSDEGDISISVIPPLELVSTEQIESLNTASYYSISREVFDSWEGKEGGEAKKLTDKEFYQVLLEKLKVGV
jgi:hypothetical protein